MKYCLYVNRYKHGDHVNFEDVSDRLNESGQNMYLSKPDKLFPQNKIQVGDNNNNNNIM